jgi:hypothetical protein
LLLFLLLLKINAKARLLKFAFNSKRAKKPEKVSRSGKVYESRENRKSVYASQE